MISWHRAPSINKTKVFFKMNSFPRSCFLYVLYFIIIFVRHLLDFTIVQMTINFRCHTWSSAPFLHENLASIFLFRTLFSSSGLFYRKIKLTKLLCEFLQKFRFILQVLNLKRKKHLSQWTYKRTYRQAYTWTWRWTYRR